MCWFQNTILGWHIVQFFLGGRAQKVLSVVPITRLRNAANQTVFPGYYVEAEKGTRGNQVQIFWQEPVHGEVMLVVSCEK